MRYGMNRQNPVWGRAMLRCNGSPLRSFRSVLEARVPQDLGPIRYFYRDCLSPRRRTQNNAPAYAFPAALIGDGMT